MNSDDTQLPQGFTCNDCLNFKSWCQRIIGLTGSETACDYAPSKFRHIPPPHPEPETLAVQGTLL